MRPARLILVLGILALTVLHPVAFPQKPSPDLILFNGKIFTSSASQPYAEALAIRGDRIVAAVQRGPMRTASSTTKPAGSYWLFPETTEC